MAPSRLYVRRGSTIHFCVIGLLLTLSGDIELNPGPVRFPCGRCGRAVKSNQRGICCDQCDRWHHVACTNLIGEEYARLSNSLESWVCAACLTLTTRQDQQDTQADSGEHDIVRLHCAECHRVIQTNFRRICCHQCSQWFHVTCADVCNDRLTNNRAGWVCQACIRHTNRLLQNRTHQTRLHTQQQVEEGACKVSMWSMS